MSKANPLKSHSTPKRSVAAARPTRRRDDGTAFLPDPSDGPVRVRDSLAEDLAEQFLTAATSGEESLMKSHNRVLPEEFGGPFVPSNDVAEFGTHRDETNPPGTEPEALPSPMRGTP